MKPALFAAVVLALAAPALAQPAPLTLPAHDVSIVYRLTGAARDAAPGGLPGTVRLDWNAARQRLLVVPEGRTQSLLVDLANPHVDLVDSGLRSAMALPVRAKDLDPIKLRDAHLTRRGHANVAGHDCTDYAVESHRGHGTICLTDDGVALRGDGDVDGKQGSFTALSVAYTPLAASLFEVPQGYMQLALPRMDRLR